MRQNYRELQKTRQKLVKQTKKNLSSYMEIFESAYSTIAGKVAVQDNPYYSIPSEHPVKTKDNLPLCYFT